MENTDSIITSFGIIIAFCILLKIYLQLSAGICTNKESMEGKTVIVTGANSGIGLETARGLAERKAKVILACRNIFKGREAMDSIKSSTGNQNVLVRYLDLASLTSVRKFASDIMDSEEQLHVLINNAGVTPPPDQLPTEDNLELQFATNHFGPFLLTCLLLPLLKKSAPARIVVVSSVVHWWASLDLDNLNCEKYVRQPYWIYCSTKLANILFTRELSKKLDGTGITVNALHPGGVRTSIARDIHWFIKYVLIPICYPFLKSSQSGAQTSIYLAVSEDVGKVSGRYFSDCRKACVSKKARNDKLAKKLWGISEKLTGITELTFSKLLTNLNQSNGQTQCKAE